MTRGDLTGQTSRPGASLHWRRRWAENGVTSASSAPKCMTECNLACPIPNPRNYPLSTVCVRFAKTEGGSAGRFGRFSTQVQPGTREKNSEIFSKLSPAGGAARPVRFGGLHRGRAGCPLAAARSRRPDPADNTLREAMRRSSATSSPGIGEDSAPGPACFSRVGERTETLIETRRTSSSRRESATGRFRAGTARPPGSASGSLVSRRGIRAVLVGSGLAGLLGATACAVASVSAWLVPVYLLLVVVILTAPRGSRASSPAAGSRAGFLGTRIAEPGQGAGEGRADGTGSPEPGPDARQDPDLAAGESDDAQPSHLRLDPAAAAIARPRRSKARTRKAAKPAAELAPEFAPVTWVRVGPGKYVRSDTIIQGQRPGPGRGRRIGRRSGNGSARARHGRADGRRSGHSGRGCRRCRRLDVRGARDDCASGDGCAGSRDRPDARVRGTGGPSHAGSARTGADGSRVRRGRKSGRRRVRYRTLCLRPS